MKFKVFSYKSVTSTNDIAINIIKKKKSESGCVFAETQTKGRGTHGRKWISVNGNFFASIFFPLKKNFPPFNEFSIINPVIVSNIVKYYCKKKISFKWPNDLFINKKKICGILQEHITSDEKTFLVVGIGINVAKNPSINDQYETTSIFLESKKKPQINEIINLTVSYYEKFFSNLDTYNYANYKKKII